ncbi:MAG: D-alanyl-D-alanine carboxypeptidase/D-alanyl-D-alanine-endopeptidase [bacterium]
MKRSLVFLLLYFLLFSFLARAGEPFPFKAEIDTLVSEAAAEDVEYGLLIQEGDSGRVLYSKNADVLLNPASNTKILTALASLSLLGPDFTFRTRLLGSETGERGVLKTLTLKGFGDPTFSTERLEDMVKQLQARGIKKVEQVAVDGSYFDGEEFPGQMEGRQRDAVFNCNVGAVSIDHNLLELELSPGEKIGKAAKVEMKPPMPGYPMKNEVVTAKKKGRIVVKNAGKDEEDLTLSLKGPIALGSEPLVYKISVHRPHRLAALKLIQALKNQGIETPEKAQLVCADAKDKMWAETQSPPLIQILQEMNKNSDNFIAEQLTKILGAQFAGLPGNTEKGVKVILKRLKELGVRTQGVEIENGSGLSKKNRLRPSTLADVLEKAYQDPKLRANFLSTLSVLGVDGTLKRKFRNTDMAGRFLGKTGTLNGVSSLSGYLFPKSGENGHPYIFSFILNGKGKNFWKEKQMAQDVLELLLTQTLAKAP